uniref:Zinc finger ZZ-type and EF-hand domain containing 1 n=1 Tax=Oncorhynchus tshawytscha TaxID=74940 RepID=A0AAZ3PWD1_ONCTS
MGNAESGCGGGSGDEEDVEAESPGFAEGSPASAATGVGVANSGGSGSGRSGRGSNNPPVPGCGPPTPGVLLEQVKLREAAARISDSGVAIPESVLAGNEGVLVRWLEDRLSRGEESVNVEQFCEMLESRDAPRDECEEAFGQFDAEGDGVVDVENMLMALKNSNGANLQGELSHVIRQLQACTLTPGFVDIFSKSKDRLGAHASKILKFLHRNRIPSSAIPFPVLEGYNSICTMRSTVVQDFLEFLLQKEKELNRDPEVDKVKVVTQCYNFIEASSNAADIHKMTNGETVTFWQSDGSARSHWIRLKMKPDVVLRRLAIAVASNDHSYMPQLVSVAVGKNRRSLQEIKDVRIPSNVTGYVALLENANITHPYIQINIKRCLSDGCDTRIHGLKTLGYQITKSKEVSVSDASAIWYLSLLTSLVTASMETNPVLAQTVLHSTQKALKHMPPLSLTPSSTEFPKFFSMNILEEVDGFLLRIADCCVTPDAELTLLAFALARGSVAKILQSLSGISEHLEAEYRASSLISSMASVRLRLLYRKTLQLHLQACDVKGKEEKSGPENMLTESAATGDGFLTESGKKRASVILSTEDQSNFQVTQMKVRKGAIGAKCGLVFAYSEGDTFDAEKHFKRFKKYDSWNYKDYKEFVLRIPLQAEDEPIGWFELEDDWNDVEIKLQTCRVARFLMVKFLCARQDSAERLGVQSLSFSGYLCPGAERLDDLDDLSPQGDGSEGDMVTGLTLLKKTLFFIQQLTRDMVPTDVSLFKQKFLLDFSGLNLILFWNGPEAEGTVDKALRKEAVKAVLNGAAIFFPDKQSRRDKLFHMMKNITEEDQPESVKLTFESLCNYFSDQDPSGLLLLPPKGAPSDFDISPILSVMETLLLVATRECEVMMVDVSGGASRKVLLSLFWALQGSLLSWCYLQLKGGARDAHANLLVCQMLMLIPTLWVCLCQMIFLLELCFLDIPHCILLTSFSSLVVLLKNLSSETADIFSKVDLESCQQPQQPVVLRTWNMESPHNYENSRHETTIFACPGATSFEVEFDERSETEKRYDYLEFTDARGGKVRYDMKVGTEKWPKKVTFEAGPQLQFLFHSDSSNNEWGYKFTVTAHGLPDITVSWMSDLQLLVARLMGRLASRTMALKSPHEIRSVKELPAGKMAHVLSSPLWKPVFRHGLIESPHVHTDEVWCTSTESVFIFPGCSDCFMRFCDDFGHWNPTEEPLDSRTQLMKSLMLACKKQPIRNEIVAGWKADMAVNAIFAAMIYHTPALNQALRIYVASQGGQASLSEDFVQVFSLAESIKTWMVSNHAYLWTNVSNLSLLPLPSPLAEMVLGKANLLLRFPPSGASSRLDTDFSRVAEGSAVLLRSTSISEGDFQPSTSLGTQSSQAAGSEGLLGSTESLSYQPGAAEPASPSTFPRKAPSFSRGRLRLLSLRSVEEPRSAPSIKERYPLLKHIINFMKDQTLTTVRYTLSLNKAQAQSVCKVLETVQQCLLSLGKPHLFQAPCILFLQELLACQKDFTSCHKGFMIACITKVRRSYHRLVLMLVEAVQGFSSLNEKVLLPALSCVQTCLLHLLDMSWEVQDLPLFLQIKLPDLLLTMSQENISVHDIAISQWTEEDEIADYKKNRDWMDECVDGMFEKWYDKIDEEGSMEDRRKMHMFIARYCDLLNVVISCDGCERMAPWHRYRCLQCMDMDLCKTCFLSGAKPEGHEDDHEMVNMEYACDHCQGLIVGSRINCNVCEDFDLCFGCYNAKKYPDSHLPTHRITVCPMVTIRISDRHRLIQPYIHNYSWLLFAALALYTSGKHLSSERQQEGEPLGPDTLTQASGLQTRCSQLITECLLKGQTGKGRPVYLLVIGRETGNVLVRVSIESFHPCVCAEEAGETGHPRLVKPQPDPVSSISETITSPTPEDIEEMREMMKERDEKMEKTAKVPIQEHVFAECSRERILGLLAAMLPPAKPGSTLALSSLSPILPQLFRVVISNAGCLNETYHLTLGLLGQLLLRIPPLEADVAVREALADKYELLTPGEGAASGADTQGWKTTQLLFSLGAVCLDSRIGLDWACSVADILRSLNACPQWSVVIAAFTDHCVRQLPQTLKRTNLFTLLVLVGFPEVLCMGTQSVFIDNANEQHHMILLKHFTEKNHAAVVDVKTRKRKTVKDYQLIQPQDSSATGSHSPGSQLTRYLSNFTSIISHLLQSSQDSSTPDAVEASWVVSLALKGLYNTLKKHGVAEAQEAIQQSGLTQLLVRKCSKGTGFSKLWLLRDLEILSIMLYSSKREIHSMAQGQDGEREEKEQDKEHDSDHSSCCADDPDPNRPDPLEGLDEETKICFQITHDALNAPLHILRAMYELQMKRTDSFFLEVQKRFDGDVIKTDETIRTLAQKWQPTKRPRSEERSTKAVDTDMIVVPCVSKPSHCEKATEETTVVTQKLITNTETDLQLSYAKQRRTKSSALLHKELDARSNRSVRQYLVKVNQAIATLYARHVLASLLADWPQGAPLSEEALELSGASHMAYILDMLMQLEERPLWERILQKVLVGCSQSMLGSLSLTACQFMEEPGMAVQVRESKHPYDNNTNFEDKVHIPGAIYLSVKFDSRCYTEEGCDELIMGSSSDFLQDLHNFSGSPQKWTDFEIPGDTLHYRFISDMSNTEWGYKFTVTGGHRGRFQTGFEILKQMLADDQVLSHLPLADIWEWQVGVACRQTGNQRLKAIHLLLRLLQCQSQRGCELTLLRPLWQLFMTMESGLSQDPTSITVLLPLHRALTELFFIAEARAMEEGILQEYLLALTTNEQLLARTALALKNIAAISLAINYPNKSTKLLNTSP